MFFYTFSKYIYEFIGHGKRNIPEKETSLTYSKKQLGLKLITIMECHVIPMDVNH